MSPTPAPTVGDLLGGALEEKLETDDPTDGDPAAWVGVLRETLDQALPREVPRGDLRRVLVMLREATEVPIPQVLVSAWRRYEPFRKYVDPAAYPPGTESEVPLATHTARSLLEPEVEVLVSGTVVATLRFEVEVTLSLEGAVLRIRDGRFVSVRTGDCSVEVEVRFQDHLLVEVGPEEEVIPGELDFGRGLRIEPFGEDPYAPEDPGGDGDA